MAKARPKPKYTPVPANRANRRAAAAQQRKEPASAPEDRDVDEGPEVIAALDEADLAAVQQLFLRVTALKARAFEVGFDARQIKQAQDEKVDKSIAEVEAAVKSANDYVSAMRTKHSAAGVDTSTPFDIQRGGFLAVPEPPADEAVDPEE